MKCAFEWILEHVKTSVLKINALSGVQLTQAPGSMVVYLTNIYLDPREPVPVDAVLMTVFNR